jgi:peptidyl-prolyl cis-trans isomerase A (cyclophilin A)
VRTLFLTLTMSLFIFACGGEEVAPPPEPEPEPAAEVVTPEPPPKPAAPEPWTLPEGANPALTDASKAVEEAPATFKVKFETTQGDIVVQVTRDWSPQGADRFYNLVKIGYFKDIAFFRAIKNFMVQFGVSGYPEVAAVWREANLQDEEVKQSNTRGRLTYAKSGAPNSRTTQMFINYSDNSNLDGMGFAPFGEVVAGMDVLDALHTGYGEGAPRGRGPDQGKVQALGNAYLKADFPKLDYILKASIVD